jgi:hypothetical protein
MRIDFPGFPALGVYLALVCLFAGAWITHPAPRHASFALVNPLMAVADKQAKTIYTSRFASSGLVDFVHSAAVTALPDGSLMAAWIQGQPR